MAFTADLDWDEAGDHRRYVHDANYRLCRSFYPAKIGASQVTQISKISHGTFHLIKRFLQLAGRMERSQAAGCDVLNDSSDWTL